MTLTWADITLLVYLGIGFAIHLSMNGKPNTFDAGGALVRAAIILTLCYYGGMFS